MRRAGLLLLLLVLYLPALGNSASGTHPDEAWHLGTSAEMQAKGAWLTPTLDDRPNWYKPPLFYWSERAAYEVLGTNLFAARLPSALAFLAVVGIVLALGRRMYGEEKALLAALLTATAFGWVKYARLAMMDAPMALGLAIAAYATWRAAEERRPAWLLAVGLGAGMDFMIKGPVGAVLVLLLSGGFLLVRDRSLLLSRWTAGAFLAGVAVGVPWYLASYAVHGQAFYDFFVLDQNVDRFMHPWTLRGEATLLVGFLVFSMPWTFLLLGALPALRRWREPAVLLPLTWAAAVLVTFTVPSLKWPHYGLTAIPPAMLLVAGAPVARWARAATGAVLALVALAALLALRWPLPWTVSLSLLAAGALLAGASAAAFRGRLAASAAVAGAAFALLVVVVVPGVNPPALPPEAVPAAGGRPLWVYDKTPGLFTLSAGQPVRRAWNPGEAEAALLAGGALIASDAQVARLSPEVRDRLSRLARWRRIPGYLPEDRAWRSWRDRNPDEVWEWMSIVAVQEGKGGARSGLP